MVLVLLAAFVAGALTIASPCVLMVLPVILSASSTGGRLRPLGIVLAFAASFTVFTLAFAGALQALALPASWLRTLAIVALGLFGVAMLVPAVGRAWERLLSPLARASSVGDGRPRTGFAGGLLIGAGLGLLWAPCAGPLMAFAIGLTAIVGLTAQGLAITLAYTLGAGVPMLLIGYGTRGFVARAKRLGRNTAVLQSVFGAVLVVACVALLFGLDTQVQAFMQRTLPQEYTSALTAIEQQDSVQSQLKMLRAETSKGPVVAAAQPTPAAQQPTKRSSVPATSRPIVELKDLGPAPELTGIQGWINSKPLTLRQLRGKVVIIDFWTFDCYNCQNTQPYVRALYDKYKSQGLEIIGVHAPEFAYEKVPDSVRAAAHAQGVDWPIALDPDFKTWDAYNNEYWPAFYFIDANGHLRYTHFGEGNYDYNAEVVQELLREAHSAQ